MRKIFKFIFWTIVIIIAISVVSSFFQPTDKRIKGERWAKDKIAILYIDGIILGGRKDEGIFSSRITTSDEVVEILKDIKKDKDIKAVVIRLNSPGGSIAAAQEIFDEIIKLKKDGRKIVASFADIATSGAYYVSLACDQIIANPGTLTGSIGVIMEIHNMEELLKKIGIDFEIIKSGKYKDIGIPTRKLKKDEREILQNLLDDVYDQFISEVSRSRKMKISDVKKIADGRVFTGRQAKELKLIDKLGNFEYAIKTAMTLAKIKGDVKIIEYKDDISPLRELFGAFREITGLSGIKEKYATIR